MLSNEEFIQQLVREAKVDDKLISLHQRVERLERRFNLQEKELVSQYDRIKVLEALAGPQTHCPRCGFISQPGAINVMGVKT